MAPYKGHCRQKKGGVNFCQKPKKNLINFLYLSSKSQKFAQKKHRNFEIIIRIFPENNWEISEFESQKCLHSEAQKISKS